MCSAQTPRSYLTGRRGDVGGGSYQNIVDLLIVKEVMTCYQSQRNAMTTMPVNLYCLSIIKKEFKKKIAAKYKTKIVKHLLLGRVFGPYHLFTNVS